MNGFDDTGTRIMPSINIDDVFNNNDGNIGESNSADPFGNNNVTIQCNYTNGHGLCLSNDQIDFHLVPLNALCSKSRELLSKRLNSIKVIPSENGVPRDWRGILQCTGGRNDSYIQQKYDPLKEVLINWYQNDRKNATLGRLRQILGSIDRWDVVDDAHECFVEDSINFLRAKNENGNEARNPVTIELTKQKYDAFILFADEDVEFATEVIDYLEQSNNLKIYVKERDMPIGTFESDEIIEMIRNHCDHMIVILSKSFSKSRVNAFFLKYAQWNGIAQDKRKVIPLAYEECAIPQSLEHCSLLRYYRPRTKFFDFWKRLDESLENQPSLNQSLPSIVITETDTPSLVESEPEESSDKNPLDEQIPECPQTKKKRKPKFPTTPKAIKEFLTNFQRSRSQTSVSSSMGTLGSNDPVLDKANKRFHSSLSLPINSISSPTQLGDKKKEWYPKFLSPNTAYRTAESDSSVGIDNSVKRKKKWYAKIRSRSRSRSKNPESVSEN